MEWISIDKKLPEKSGIYLVVIKTGDEGNFVIMASYHVANLLNNFSGWTLLNEWHDLTSRLSSNISHWMPIPDPPNV